MPARPTPLTQGEQIAVRSPTNGDKAMTIDGAPLVFVGYGVKAPERGWDDFKGQDMRGKILVMLVNDPDFEGGEGDFGGKAMTYYGRWTYKYEEGARQGAKGVLVIHETEPASYGWATVKNSNTNAMFDIVRQNPAAEHPPLEGWIQRDLAAQLFAASGTSFEAMKAAAKRKDFKPVPLKAKLIVHGEAKTEVITSHNVVGILPGTARPDETVIYTGHWDHLGIGEPDANGDRIYNGAIDNGTGIAQLIEQARAFASGPRTAALGRLHGRDRRGKGPAGQRILCRQPALPGGQDGRRDQYRCDGRARPGAATLRSAATRSSACSTSWSTEGAKRGRRYTPDPRPETGGFFRSDHFTLAKAGIPAMSFGPGQDLVNGGVPRAAGLAKPITPPKCTTSRTMNIRPTGTSPEWPRMPSCSTRSACGSPTAATGRTGARTANSAPPATQRRRAAGHLHRRASAGQARRARMSAAKL